MARFCKNCAFCWKLAGDREDAQLSRSFVHFFSLWAIGSGGLDGGAVNLLNAVNELTLGTALRCAYVGDRKPACSGISFESIHVRQHFRNRGVE